jgi:ABC-2 type transport system permease protein
VTAARPITTPKHATYWSRYRHALWLLTVRDLKLRYTTTTLGYLWSIIDPLLMSLIYFVVFTTVFHRGNASENPYLVFLLVGMLPWNWFSGNLVDATKAFRSEGKLIRSVKIPRTIWILRQILSKGIEFLISLPVLAFFALIYLKAPSLQTLYVLPLALVLQIVLTTGLSFIIAPLSVFFKDLERIVRLVTRLFFYAAPVLYHIDIGHPLLHFVYGLNPMSGVLELYRAIFFPQFLDWGYVVQSAIAAIVLFAVGTVVFRRAVPLVLKEI